MRPQTQRRPTARPLRCAEVLVAVRGPSPGEGGREKHRTPRTALQCGKLAVENTIFFVASQRKAFFAIAYTFLKKRNRCNIGKSEVM